MTDIAERLAAAGIDNELIQQRGASMFDDIKVIQSAEASVKKLVLTKTDAVAETVLYRYPTYAERTVICCSSQSGCPVGCRFCGAGDYFVRSFSADEIVAQVDAAISESKTDAADMKKLQIMFMSMGEPLLNRNGMLGALRVLHAKYPHAALLISTIGPDIDWSWVIEISKEIPKIGLQFSIHQPNDAARDTLIPFKRKLALKQIATVGRDWWIATGRKPFFNYCAGDDNTSHEASWALGDLFDPQIWECTISVICERNEGLPARNAHQEELARDFSAKMLALGFSVRVFDPAGQDDIGGGCGQLWFVQDWMAKNGGKAKPSIGNGLPKVYVPSPNAAALQVRP